MSVYQRSHNHGVPDASAPQDAQEAEEEWDTDPDYVNNISDKDRRWGSKEIGTAKGSGEYSSVQEGAKKAIQQHEEITQGEYTSKKSLYGGQ